ncbi:MAG: OmpA family protein [Prevotellaceae bacterium]|nr:OmpA family protein [Prevotellaceae bacterium]
MKKLMIALALVAFSASAFAQETVVPSKKYSVATNSFWANWFISVGGEYHATYSSQEDPSVSPAPFTSKRGTFGYTAAIGKWFTPSIGLRTKFQGHWMRRVNTPEDHKTFKYFNVHEDVMFNLSNMFFGYNEKRVWNFIPYVGLGFMRNMSNDRYDFTYNVGILNNFRVAKHVSIFFDIFAFAFEGENDVAPNDHWGDYKKYHIRHWDKLVGADLGLTFNLGKCTWEKTPDVDALIAMNKEQMDALNASLKNAQDENARLRDMLANQKPAEKVVETKTVTKTISTAASVFFNLNSSKIASRKDLVNVKEVVETAKASGSKIVVTGYADSKTGNATINQRLSQARAEAVAQELVKMGVSRDNIEVVAAGGVDMISPYSYNRRATVQIK